MLPELRDEISRGEGASRSEEREYPCFLSSATKSAEAKVLPRSEWKISPGAAAKGQDSDVPGTGRRLMGISWAGFSPKIASGLPPPEVHLQAHHTTAQMVTRIAVVRALAPNLPITRFSMPIKGHLRRGACPLSGLFPGPPAH